MSDRKRALNLKALCDSCVRNVCAVPRTLEPPEAGVPKWPGASESPREHNFEPMEKEIRGR